MASPTSNSAVVIGATGLVGRECVKQLAARPEFERVTAVARRALPDDLQSPRLRTVLDRLRPPRRTARRVPGKSRVLRPGHHHQAGRQPGAVPAGGFWLSLASCGAGQGGRRTPLSAGEQRRCELCVARVLSPGERGPGGGDRRAGLPVGHGRAPVAVARAAGRNSGWAKRSPCGCPGPFRASIGAVHVRDVARALVSAAVEDRPGVRVIENPEVSAQEYPPRRWTR